MSGGSDTFAILGDTFVVVDPLGREAGEKLGRVALQAFRESPPSEAIEQGLERANRAVHDAIEADRALLGGGCTIAALRLREGVARVAWAGDVLVYRLRGEVLSLLTRPHVVQGNVIHRALGMRSYLEIDTFDAPVEEADVYLLASDGVCGTLGDAMLRMELRAHRDDLRACARALLDDASVNHPTDHQTVVLATPGPRSATPPSGGAAAIAVDSAMRTTRTKLHANEAIKALEVLVIDEDGAKLGPMPTDAALALARARGLDLVEANPHSNPPVCKILDLARLRGGRPAGSRGSPL